MTNAPKLYRSRDQSVIAGVCGGIAEYFNIDVTLVRLAWALVFFAGGTGGMLYLLAWVIIPEAPRAGAVRPAAEATRPAEPSRPAEPASAAEPEVLPPETETEEEPVRPAAATPENRGQNRAIGFILVGLGGLFLVQQFIPWALLHRLWPLGLVAIGVIILLGGRRR